jgi:serine/threonine-protein kinase RsbW
MPKLTFKSRLREAKEPVQHFVAELELDGFIDAAQQVGFERALNDAARTRATSLIVDFRRVQYINSSGISALIRSFEVYRARGGVLCLAAVARPVGLSMHLLGVTSLIPFAKDLEAARALVDDHAAGKSAGESAQSQALAAPGAETVTPRKVFLRETGQARTPTGKVMVISPSKNRFTSVLRRYFGRLNGDYHLALDTREALRAFKTLDPDLVVVDHRCDPKGEFVSRLKVQKRHSLTSIIKIYSSTDDVDAQLDFKVWENDYLVDPFEMLELFSLTEAELRRVPKDRKVFSQQVRFQFRTVPDSIEKAYKLSDLVIRQALTIEDDVTALYAAVKEGIDNAVVHGNRSQAQKRVDVNFLVDQSKVTVLIEDEGKGFDFEYYLSRLTRKEAFEEARRRILDEGIRGGLGILLMSKCSDRIEYSAPGNVLRLEKNVR